MDKKILLAAALTCVVGVASAQGDNVIKPKQGDKEVGFSGNFTSVSGSNSYSINGNVGFYVTDNIVAQVGLGWFKSGGGSTTTNIFVGGRYEFPSTSPLTPYVLLGAAFNDTGSNNTTTIKGGVGANYMLRANVAFFTELTFFKLAGTQNTATSLDFGLRVFFR